MRLLRFGLRRVVFAAPQILLILIATFLLVRLLPGDPARQLAGPYSTEATRTQIEQRFGLDESVGTQFVTYVENLLQGDLGDSWFTSQPVSQELATRFPATLELITAASVIIVIGGILLGALVGITRAKLPDRLVALYGSLAGAFPDFWLGLALAYLLFFVLGWFPAPIGRIDIGIAPPEHITGFYTVDSVLTANWAALRSSLEHLALPVLTLVIVYTAPILKMTRATTEQMLRSDFCAYARASGLPERTVLRYALRNSLPPVVTLVGLTYGFLLGGAVLVENVFSWGGLGSWVVDSVNKSDYFPVQGFVLVAALFNLALYFIVDLVHHAIDPRAEL